MCKHISDTFYQLASGCFAFVITLKGLPACSSVEWVCDILQSHMTG